MYINKFGTSFSTFALDIKRKKEIIIIIIKTKATHRRCVLMLLWKRSARAERFNYKLLNFSVVRVKFVSKLL